ncbi:MAG TPA: SRPBCC domain-containing protein [Chitinophagaceae bacterium]|nr:SRPBCC domain-containing protein [Chitinophagaceae bacterium]
MEKQTFKTLINAPREKVWKTLWGKNSYPSWTAAFTEGSHVETDWKKGSKAFFLDAKNEGMVSTIAENKPNEFMSIKHLGFVKNGIEDIDSEESRKWAGALENYKLTTVNGKTELTVEMDITDEYREMFMKTWPRALDRVKELAEKN